MKRVMRWAAVVVCVWMLGAPAARCQEAETAPDSVPPAKMAEYWSAYVAGLRKTALYQVADAMRKEKVDADVRAAADEAGVGVELRTRSFLQFLVRYPIPVEVQVAPGMRASLGMDIRELPDDPIGQHEVFELGVWAEDGTPVGPFRVSPELLAELAFPFVEEVVLVHPANRPVDLDVTDQSLTDLLKMLTNVGRMDYSIRSDLGAGTLLTLKAKRQSPLELLRLAAMTAGWVLTLNPSAEPGAGSGGMFDGGSGGVPAASRPAIFDKAISAQEVLSRFAGRAQYGLSHPDAKPIVTPTDALMQLVRDGAAEMMSRRYVVTLTYPGGLDAAHR